MSNFPVVFILAALVAAPCVANAGKETAPATHKADGYAFEAKQYRAAGKPVTSIIAQRYTRLSLSSRGVASEAHPTR